jgi:hypothetical protein
MSRNLLDEIRRIILRQTSQLGTPVANIYGGVRRRLGASTGSVQDPMGMASILGDIGSSPTGTSTNPAGIGGSSLAPAPIPQTAELFVLPGSASYASIDDFFTQFAATSSGTESVITLVDGVGGYATASTGFSQTFAAAVFRGLITSTVAQTVTMSVIGSTYIVAIDGVVQRTGGGQQTFTLAVDAGAHTLTVLGYAHGVVVALPTWLAIDGSASPTPAPTWRSLTTGYLNPTSALTVNVLTWQADVFAKGWRVLRLERADLGLITIVGAVSSGRFSMSVKGNQAISPGMQIYAGSQLTGIVYSVNYDSGTDTTDVVVTLDPAFTDSSSAWVGRLALVGGLVEVGSMSRTSGQTSVTWTDLNVVPGKYYEYGIQAQALFGTGWSPVSDLRAIRAGDATAPGAISFAFGYPLYTGGAIQVNFSTPADTDYQGVQVYYRQSFAGTVSSVTGTTLAATASIFTGHDVTGWTIRITSGTGLGQERQIVSNGTYYVVIPSTDPWAITPDSTSAFLVFMDQLIKTDYGLPATSDNLSFTPVSTTTGVAQLYQFRSFDKSLNVESDDECASWTFNPP